MNNLDKKTIFSYSVLAVPLAFLGIPLYIYLPTFYVEHVKLDISLVGIALLLARFFDLFTDIFIGKLSDNYFSRKSFIFFGLIFLLFSFYYLAFPSTKVSIFYLFSFALLVYTAWSIITIAYFSLSAEISPSYKHTNVLSSSREFFTIIAVVFALLLPYILKISQDSQKTIEFMFYMILFLFPFCFFIFNLNIKNSKKIASTMSIKDTLVFIQNNIKNLKTLYLGFFLNSLANALPATLFIFFVTHILKQKDLVGLFLIIYFFSGLIALYFWYKLSLKISKEKAWIISMLLSIVVFSFVLFIQKEQILFFALICFFSGLSLGADMFLPSSIQADIAAKFTKQNHQITGTLFSFWAILTKLALAFAVGISFSLLGFVDFQANPNSQASSYMLYFLYSLLPIIIKVFALYLIWSFSKTNNQQTNK